MREPPAGYLTGRVVAVEAVVSRRPVIVEEDRAALSFVRACALTGAHGAIEAVLDALAVGLAACARGLNCLEGIMDDIAHGSRLPVHVSPER